MRKLVLLSLAITPACLAGGWTRLTTPHFEMVTTATAAEGREAILYFERVRSFFLQASPLHKTTDKPVRIVALHSAREFAAYRTGEMDVAYYATDRRRNYIVMEGIGAAYYPVAIHEFTHLMVDESGMKLPVWLNEGWADVYSTLRPAGAGKFIVGDVIAGRVEELRQGRWIPLRALTAAGRGSDLYNKPRDVGMFYAESWALAHMLYLSPEYGPRFASFLAGVSAGQSMEQACRGELGKSLERVESDLHSYLDRRRLMGLEFRVKADTAGMEPVAAAMTELGSGLVKADLWSAIHKDAKAVDEYDWLRRRYPDRPEVDESLGYRAWANGDESGARRHFELAMKMGTKDARMCYDTARLERAAGDPGRRAATALQRAVWLKPDYAAARIELGRLWMEQGQYEAAVEELRRVKRVAPEQAVAYYLAMAQAYWKTGRAEEAREEARIAKKWARTAGESERAEAALRGAGGGR